MMLKNKVKLIKFLSIIFLIFILVYFIVWIKGPIYCEENNYSILKETLTKYLLDIINHEVFTKRFGGSSSPYIKTNTFYETQINENFIKHFVDSSACTAILFDLTMDSKVQLEKLLGLFYDYVENAEKKYSLKRLKEILNISGIEEYLVELINQLEFKQGFTEMPYQIVNQDDPEEMITTKGYKKLCEDLYNMQKDAQQQKLQNILLRTISIKIRITDKETKLYITCLIFRYEYTFKKA